MSQVTTTARELVELIRDLDRGTEANTNEQTEYLEITRWNADGSSGGNRDDAATTLVRALLRERLGAFALDEIGAATLAAIDEEAA